MDLSDKIKKKDRQIFIFIIIVVLSIFIFFVGKIKYDVYSFKRNVSAAENITIYFSKDSAEVKTDEDKKLFSDLLTDFVYEYNSDTNFPGLKSEPSFTIKIDNYECEIYFHKDFSEVKVYKKSKDSYNNLFTKRLANEKIIKIYEKFCKEYENDKNYKELVNNDFEK